MGTSKQNAVDEISSENWHLRHNQTHTLGDDLDALREESHCSDLAEQVEKKMIADQQEGVLETVSDQVFAVASQSVPRDGFHLLETDHLKEKDQQSRNPDTGGDQSQVTHFALVISTKRDSLQDKPKIPVSLIHTSDATQQTRRPGTKTPSSGPPKEASIVTAIDEMTSDALPQIQSPNAGPVSSQSNQVTVAYSVGTEKSLDKLQPRRNPDTVVQFSQSNRGSTPSITPERPYEDGYNWRKYGQKLVKGNEFIRSYYKCTYINCVAKKQVERSYGGKITDINYLGRHEHPKPQHAPHTSSALAQTQVVKHDTPIMNISEANKTSGACVGTFQPESAEVILPSAVVASESVGGDMRDNIDTNASHNLKRQKREISAPSDPMMNKSCSEVRQVVQTRSEVDLVNDGYRWRKYGQKLVKGNPNPRSYYRCSNAGCLVKKHVERASHDPKLVITTYEGQHNHEMPASRAVTQNASGSDAKITAVTGELRSEPGESKPNRLDMVHIGAN